MSIIYATSNATLCATVELSESDGFVARVYAVGAEIASASFPCSLAQAISWASEMLENDA